MLSCQISCSADGFVALRHLASIQAVKSELSITLWGRKLLQFVSRGQLIKPRAFILQIKKKKKMGHEISPGTTAAAAGQRCGSEMQQLLKKNVRCERTTAVLLLWSRRCRCWRLAGSTSRGRYLPLLKFDGKTPNLENKQRVACTLIIAVVC